MKQEALHRLIEEECAKLCKAFPAKPENLYDPIRYALSSGGKRLRPALVLIGADLFGGKPNVAIPAALAIELFHNFTLLHDDIMDNAPMRRGNPSVHAKWNANIAILSGDAMYTEAFRQLSLCPSVQIGEILNVFTRTAAEVCEGQQHDMDFEKQNSVSIAQYLHMIELKTAVLLGAALQIGALCAGANVTESKKLYEFGKQAGIAFQLQDDLLDVFGDENKFGKKKGGDIVLNKKTFLLLKAFELANNYQKEELQHWLLVSEKDSTEKIAGVTALYNTFGIKEKTEHEMQLHYNAGIAALDRVKADEVKKASLKGFMDALMVRES